MRQDGELLVVTVCIIYNLGRRVQLPSTCIVIEHLSLIEYIPSNLRITRHIFSCTVHAPNDGQVCSPSF